MPVHTLLLLEPHPVLPAFFALLELIQLLHLHFARSAMLEPSLPILDLLSAPTAPQVSTTNEWVHLLAKFVLLALHHLYLGPQRLFHVNFAILDCINHLPAHLSVFPVMRVRTQQYLGPPRQQHA
jgi:hypothetical protein